VFLKNLFVFYAIILLAKIFKQGFGFEGDFRQQQDQIYWKKKRHILIKTWVAVILGLNEETIILRLNENIWNK
jgi:hypothetical protein